MPVLGFFTTPDNTPIWVSLPSHSPRHSRMTTQAPQKAFKLRVFILVSASIFTPDYIGIWLRLLAPTRRLASKLGRAAIPPLKPLLVACPRGSPKGRLLVMLPAFPLCKKRKMA